MFGGDRLRCAVREATPSARHRREVLAAGLEYEVEMAADQGVVPRLVHEHDDVQGRSWLARVRRKRPALRRDEIPEGHLRRRDCVVGWARDCFASYLVHLTRSR